MGLSTGTVCCDCARPVIWRFGICETYRAHLPYGIQFEQWVTAEGDTNGFFRSLGSSDVFFLNINGLLNPIQIGGYVDLKKLSGTNWELEVFINGIGRNTATFDYDFFTSPTTSFQDVTMVLDEELQLGVAVTLRLIENTTDRLTFKERVKDVEPARFTALLPNTDPEGLTDASMKGVGKFFIEEDMVPTSFDTSSIFFPDSVSPGYNYDFDDPAQTYDRAYAITNFRGGGWMVYGIVPYYNNPALNVTQVFPLQMCDVPINTTSGTGRFDNFIVENPNYPTKRLDFEIDVDPYTSKGFVSELQSNTLWGATFFSDDFDMYDDSFWLTFLLTGGGGGTFEEVRLVKQEVDVTVNFGELAFYARSTFQRRRADEDWGETGIIQYFGNAPAVESGSIVMSNIFQIANFLVADGLTTIELNYGFRGTLRNLEKWNIPGRTITNATTRTFYLRLPKQLITEGKDITPGFNWRLTAGKSNQVGGIAKGHRIVPAIPHALSVHAGSLPPGMTLVRETANSNLLRIRGNIPAEAVGQSGFIQLRWPTYGFISEPYYWEIGQAEDVIIVYPSPYTNSDIQPAAGFDWRIDDSDEYEIEATIINAADPVTVTLESGDLPPGGILDAATGRIHSDGLAIFQNPATGSCVLKVVDDDLKEGLSVTYNWQYFGEEDPVFGSQLYPSPYTNSATPPAAGFDWRIDGANAVSILPIADFTTTAHTFEIEAGSLPPESLLDATTGEIATPTVFFQQPGDSTGSVRIKVTRTSDNKSKISRDYTWEYKGL